jgi:hypothetical protein
METSLEGETYWESRSQTSSQGESPLQKVTEKVPQREFSVPPPKDRRLEVRGGVQDIEEGCVASSALLESQPAVQQTPNSAHGSVHSGREVGDNDDIPNPSAWKHFLKTIGAVITPITSVIRLFLLSSRWYNLLKLSSWTPGTLTVLPGLAPMETLLYPS